jgi:two-component system cell cycle sensor histidine kinase/response regulator CckA
MVRRLIGETIVVRMRMAPDLWSIMADAGEMQQIVLNMAINARDAMPTGGELTTELENASVSPADALQIPDGQPGDFVALTIRDTGIGMSCEVMKRIFEPFFTTKEAGKGTGLGLATCYGIVKHNLGMISVASEPGKGTEFSIYFPKTDACPIGSEQQPEIDQTTRGTETILVVEDEEILRELAVQVLQNLGYEVLTAEDGTEAIRILCGDAVCRIQLVVTDLAMPRMGGRELVAWIGQHIPGMRVLFMSGYTDDEIVRSAVESAEVAYLQKPFTPKTLALKIRELIERPWALANGAL